MQGNLERRRGSPRYSGALSVIGFIWRVGEANFKSAQVIG